MDNKLLIVLRDRSTGNQLVVVEVLGHEHNRGFYKFLSEAKGVDQKILKNHHLDCYVGYWGQQGAFQVDVEIMEFCVDNGIPLVIDFND